jgi:hypothetical protein
MKAKKLMLISVSLVATIALSALAVQVLSAAKAAKVKGRFYPRTHSIDGIPPQPWNVELKFAPPRTIDEIDTSTILLEGLYSPSFAPPPYDHPRISSRVVVPFDGYDVLAAAILKVGHMTPGTHRVVLEITGQLKDGTPFSTGSSAVIVLFVDDASPP